MAKNLGSQSRPKSAGDYFVLRLEAAFRKSKNTRAAAIKAAKLSWLTLAKDSDEDPEGGGGGQSGVEASANLFDFANFRMRGMWMAATLRLDPNNASDQAMMQAFEVAGLDPNSPFDWKELVRLFSEAYLGEHGPGRGKEWHAARYNELLLDFERVKAKYPAKLDEEICRHLLDRKPYKSKYQDIESAEYLLKKVREARKPENNYHLKHPEMPRVERILREHAELLGYDWSKWGAHFNELFKLGISESTETFAQALTDKLIAAGPALVSKGADKVDPRLEIIRKAYAEREFSWSRETESNALQILAILDEGWSQVKKV